jgi:putative DNA primase/helicase
MDRKLPCRIAIFSNELPRFNDPSGAIASRFIILQLVHSWLGREDPQLVDKLRKELPGILRWSLEGLDSLRKRGYFIEPQTSQESRQVLIELTSPHQTFIDEHCVLGPLRETPIIDLYNAWCAWCDTNGYQRRGSMQTFARDLHTLRPELKTVRPRGEDASRPRYLRGIALDPPRAPQRFGPYVPPPAAAPVGIEGME